MAIACSTRRHPQLRVTPPRSERPLTVQELPQSQRHRQHGRSSSASSAIATTTKRPNLWPIKSRNGLRISIKINFEIEERMTTGFSLHRPAGRLGMEAVEHEADGRMIGAANDFPGIAVIVDMTPPGQRLESNFQAALGRAFAKFAEIGRRAV